MLVKAINVLIKGSILQGKILQVAKCFGITDFVVVNGWLQHFKYCHEIVFKSVSVECAQVENTVIEEWLKSKDKLISQFKITITYDKIYFIIFCQNTHLL